MKRILIAAIVYASCSASASAQRAHFPALEWLDSEGHEIATDIPGRFLLDQDSNVVAFDDAFEAVVEDGLVIDRIDRVEAPSSGRVGPAKAGARKTVRLRHYLPAGIEASASLPRSLSKRGRIFVELRLGLLNEDGAASGALFDVCGATLGLSGSPDASAELVAYVGGETMPTGLWITGGFPPGEMASPLLTLEIDFARRLWSLRDDERRLLDDMPLAPGAEGGLRVVAEGEGAFASVSEVLVYHERPPARKDRPSPLTPEDEAALKAAFEPERLRERAAELRATSKESASPRRQD